MRNAGNQPFDGDELDVVFGEANPNPERVGCPTEAVLVALAARERPIDDPAYQHLAVCSPCYLHVRTLQRRSASARSFTVAMLVAAAVVVLMIGGGLWLFVLSRDARVDPQGTSARLQLDIDLRSEALERGGSTASPRRPIPLPLRQVHARVLLPVASEPGEYDLELIDAENQVRASATAAAVLRDFVTTMELDLDLRELKPGPYQIGLRRQGEDWRFFAATVR